MVKYTFDPNGPKIQEVGRLTKEIIDLLGLGFTEQNILISAGNRRGQTRGRFPCLAGSGDMVVRGCAWYSKKTAHFAHCRLA